MDLEWNREALDEANAAAAYYERKRTGLGAEFGAAVKQALETIRDFPSRWPSISRRSRRYRLDRFPYIIVYRILEDRIKIYAVAHLSRRPGYWRKRERD